MLEHFEFTQQPSSVEERAYYLLCHNQRLLYPLRLQDSAAEEPISGFQPLTKLQFDTLGVTESQQIFMGRYQSIACYAVVCDEELPFDGADWVGLRDILLEPNPELFALAGRALQLVEWWATHKYCGVCASPLGNHPEEYARYCSNCDRHYYPRLSPCIIVLITRGEELLLAQGSRHPSGMYSTLAGFIEAGESVEDCLHREVYEEVGLKVHNLRYFNSQSWPFPHQLMLGFHAEYAGGTINPDPKEISDARWWHYSDLPNHPPIATISGRLIQAYVQTLTDR